MSDKIGPDGPTTSPSSVPTGDARVSRRDFVTTTAAATAGFMIVPRHVLGRGFQAPSDMPEHRDGRHQRHGRQQHRRR